MKTIKIKSPANIAFIKYWGQKNADLVLPNNDSFSMNLSNCYSELELRIEENVEKKELFIKNYKSEDFVQANGEALEKVTKFYKVAKEFLQAEKDFGFTIYSANSFPKKAGIASSAAFFSALALAFATAFEKTLSEKDLSILARLSGSGSACRSIPDGFVWWNKGQIFNSQFSLSNENTWHDSSYAESIAKPEYWDLVDLVLILSSEEKKVGSQEGHKGAFSSPLYKYRLHDLETRLGEIRESFDQKDFSRFGSLIEQEAISMHAVMMTQNPPLHFWSGKTVEVIKKILNLRKKGIEGYFTIDAGENVHVICEKKHEQQLLEYFKQQPEVEDVITNDPCEGARLVMSL